MGEEDVMEPTDKTGHAEFVEKLDLRIEELEEKIAPQGIIVTGPLQGGFKTLPLF